MNLLLLGGTGRVGSQILSRALADGHNVTALVRSPEKLLQTANGRLRVITGNALNPHDLQAAMPGADAVISALSTDGADTLSKGMPLIVEAMQKAGVSRIITVGTAGILQSRTSSGLLRYQSGESSPKLLRANREHHLAYQTLANSRLDWTIVCPAYLPDGAETGKYRIEKDFLPENGREISVPDTAAFVYSLLFSQDYRKARVGIAY